MFNEKLFKELMKVKPNARRLLERLGIKIPNVNRCQGFFFIHLLLDPISPRTSSYLGQRIIFQFKCILLKTLDKRFMFFFFLIHFTYLHFCYQKLLFFFFFMFSVLIYLLVIILTNKN